MRRLPILSDARCAHVLTGSRRVEAEAGGRVKAQAGAARHEQSGASTGMVASSSAATMRACLMLAAAAVLTALPQALAHGYMMVSTCKCP